MSPDPKPPLTPAEFEARMRKAFATYDTEEGHAEADDLMCELLRSLGYGAGVDVFKSADKWYA